ncbi:unnamed protein product [Rotaria sp. Silwood1]|nr:unnamed protein product [Rotaria sp. Silwood1]
MLHAKSTALEVIQALNADLTDKTVLITRGTAGIGLETACALATMHAHVIITGRDMVKESVCSFAEEYIKRNLSLHILICNAGVFPSIRRLTKGGFEYNWGITYLSHFLLAQLLLPVLKRNQSSRIVVVSSLANHCAGIDFDDWN